jgi:GTP-binding protein EngB required for normal cell division
LQLQFVNSASGSCLTVGDGRIVETSRIQVSNEFELDGQRVVLIDTPGFGFWNFEKAMADIKEFLAKSYVKT